MTTFEIEAKDAVLSLRTHTKFASELRHDDVVLLDDAASGGFVFAKVKEITGTRWGVEIDFACGVGNTRTTTRRSYSSTTQVQKVVLR